MTPHGAVPAQRTARGGRVALLCAVLAFIAGAAFGLALLTSSAGARVTSSGSAAIATRTAASHGGVAASAPLAALPRAVLDYSSSGEEDTHDFTIAGSVWRLEVVCNVGAGPITVTVTFAPGYATHDHLATRCPTGSRSGKASATFHELGTLFLHITAPSTLNWEVIVSDLP